MSLLSNGLRTKQILAIVPTICKKCDKTETTKFYDDDSGNLPFGSFTKRCGCGTYIYRFHRLDKPDAHNQTSYFTKAFISAKEFDKDYKKKDDWERNGFKKLPNGKYVL